MLAHIAEVAAGFAPLGTQKTPEFGLGQPVTTMLMFDTFRWLGLCRACLHVDDLQRTELPTRAERCWCRRAQPPGASLCSGDSPDCDVQTAGGKERIQPRELRLDHRLELLDATCSPAILTGPHHHSAGQLSQTQRLFRLRRWLQPHKRSACQAQHHEDTMYGSLTMSAHYCVPRRRRWCSASATVSAKKQHRVVPEAGVR